MLMAKASEVQAVVAANAINMDFSNSPYASTCCARTVSSIQGDKKQQGISQACVVTCVPQHKGYPGYSGQSGQTRLIFGHFGCAPKSELKAPTLSVLGLRGTAAIAAAVLSRPPPIEAPAVQEHHCQAFKAGHKVSM